MRNVGSTDQSLKNSGCKCKGGDKAATKKARGNSLKSSGRKSKGGDKAAIEKARGNKAFSSNVKFRKGPFSGSGSMDGAKDEAPGSSEKISKEASTANSMSADELMANPGALKEAAEKGVSVSDLNLEQNSDGMLAENSKKEVNQMIGNLSSSLDSEVAALVYDRGDGQLGTNVYTSNEREEVSMEPPDGVIYDAHTHPDNDKTPSQTDIDNKIPGSEATVVPADDKVGNETGEYVEYGS